MKRIIDTAALYIVLSAAAFLLFLYAWRQIVPALLFSVMVFISLLNICPRVAGFFSKKRVKKAESSARVDRLMKQLIYARYDEALLIAKGAVLKKYGYDDADNPFHEEGAKFCLLQRHPDGNPVNPNDIAALYRENRNFEALVVITPCAYEEKARRAAESLSMPRFVLFDGSQMKTMFGKFTHEETAGKEPGAVAKKTRARFAVSPKTARAAAIYALLNLALYFVLGILAYLLAALFLLAIAVLGKRKHHTPDKLI